MNKWFFLFRCLFLIQLFIYINNQITSKEFDPSLNILLFDTTCVFVYDNSDNIYKMKVTESEEEILASIPAGYKNKTLIKISDNKFILFALSSTNILSYCECDKNDSDEEYSEFKSLNLEITGGIDNNPIKYKYINDVSSFLIYYIKDGEFYLYLMNNNYVIENIEGTNPKSITYEDGYELNTIDCDSHDGKNIFCVYSTIRLIVDALSYRTIGYYSFGDIDQDIENNELKRDIAGPALLKVKTLDNQKKFLICYYEFSIPIKYENPSIYCQFFVQIENKLNREKTYSIGTPSFSTLSYNNFIFQNVMQLLIHDYTIYIHLRLTYNEIKLASAIYVVPLDFNFIIPYYLEPSSEKINILLSDKYILFLTKESNIKIEATKLTAQCPKTTLFNISKDEGDITLTQLYIKPSEVSNQEVFISFDLDYLTYLYTDNIQNPGGLLYKYQLKENSQNIILKYNENLKITHNYYIYHSKNTIISAEKPEFSIFSQFCLLKVLNCYESCKTCNEYVIGTEEFHQCSSCKKGYNEFHFASKNEKNFFNCYQSEDQKVQENYYLNTTDNKYYKCDKSCLSCEDNKSCTKCNTGYYFKEDKINKEVCYDTTPPEYYLDESDDVILYKKCHFTCATCFGGGNDTINKCISCKKGYVPYPYDSSKCTLNKDDCPYYWKINETFNVECLDSCDKYIINEGSNKNQCVEDCKSYIDPFNILANSSLLNYTCINEQAKVEKHCLTLDFCKLKRLHYNVEKATCQSEDTCINVSDTSEAPLITDKLDNDVVSERTTIVKYFDFKVPFSEIKNFTQIQINIYISELRKELSTHDYQNGVDLITINMYDDFKVVLYPLYKEDYLHENVIKTNNVGFFNFYENFKGRYTPVDIKNIIVCLIEFIDIKYPINSINYFFFEYEDRYNDYEFQHKEIKKQSLVNSSSLQISIEYPLKNYNNPRIVNSYSSDLISTIKTLNSIDENANYFDSNSDFYTDICTTFTSEIGTDMTLYDRSETYSTQISFCENGCKLINLIDKGEKNPRALCNCSFKTNLIKDNNYYTFVYEKKEGKNVANINALKCGTTAFHPKKVDNNFVFWIFIFFILIFAIVVLIIVFCGKNSIEDILKVKKVVEESENEEQKNNNENIYNMSEKISSVNSEDKYQSIDVKDNKSNSQKGIISSKISYAAPPPKKPKETNSTKENNHIGSGVESINTTINLNNKIELRFKNDEEMFDEIFPDYNDVLNNNVYENKYMKNNYINLKLTNLKLKKYFLSPIEKDELIKHNNTDNEDDLGDVNYVKYKTKKSAMFNYYQTLLPKANISKNILKNYYKRERFNSDDNINKNDNNKNYVLKNSIKFLEDSDFLGDEMDNNPINLKKKGKTKLKLKNPKRLIDGDSKNLFLQKKKKSLFNSDNSSRLVSNSLDKYFLNSSNVNNNIHYSFIKFFWLYLNKREFCLVSIYNLQENVPSLIRLTTFIFVISLLFSMNCLLLTESQIHERHMYMKEHGSINEFTYVFGKESGIIFADVFIYLIIKMLFIKFIYEKLFRISQSAKEDLTPFGNDESEKSENEENEENTGKKEKSVRTIKRNAFIKQYNKKSLIYIGIIFAVMILLGYISVCYIGIFKNTKGGVVLRFVIAFIFSIIFCAIFCLIIVTIYHYMRKTGKNWLKTAYNIARIVY